MHHTTLLFLFTVCSLRDMPSVLYVFIFIAGPSPAPAPLHILCSNPATKPSYLHLQTPLILIEALIRKNQSAAGAGPFNGGKMRLFHIDNEIL